MKESAIHQSTSARYDDIRHLSDALAFRVQRTARLLRQHLAALLHELDVALTPEQYFLLFRVSEHPSRSQTELADAVLADHANITRLTDSLARKGLIVREPDPADRRRHLLHITAVGKETVGRILACIPAERRALYGDLPEQDLEAFDRVLDHLASRAAMKLGAQ